MKDVKISSIPTLTVAKAVDNLSKIYVNAIRDNVPFKALPSVMLWGAPGQGKSQAIRQLASEIELKTGKTVVITDVRLLLFNPIDLRGIPTANADKTLAVWLKPKIFQMDDSSKVVNVLFLDEISACPQSVQSAAYQITLDRVIGEHKLPDNCIVIAAGNRTTDKSVAYKMPKALANRLMHFQIEGNFNAWKKWAQNAKIHPLVIGFLSFKPDTLSCFDPQTDDLAFATPRTWEMVSNVIKVVGDVSSAYDFIAGLVGKGLAVEFKAWVETHQDLPSIEDIFSGKFPTLPTRQDVMYALVSGMVEYAKKHKENLEKIGNSIAYSLKMPADYSALLIREYLAIEKGYEKTLLLVPEYVEWSRKRGGLLNGTV